MVVKLPLVPNTDSLSWGPDTFTTVQHSLWAFTKAYHFSPAFDEGPSEPGLPGKTEKAFFSVDSKVQVSGE